MKCWTGYCNDKCKHLDGAKLSWGWWCVKYGVSLHYGGTNKYPDIDSCNKCIKEKGKEADNGR